MLLCRCLALCVDPETVCCCVAPCHQGGGVSRVRHYPSDATDAQGMIDPLLPDPAWLAGSGGRPKVRTKPGMVHPHIPGDPVPSPHHDQYLAVAVTPPDV